MSTSNTAAGLEPRFEERGSFRLAGFSRILTFDQVGEIPQLWQKFGGQWGEIPGQVNIVGYGVCFVPPDGNPGCFGYLAAVEVTEDAGISGRYGRDDDPGAPVRDRPAHRPRLGVRQHDQRVHPGVAPGIWLYSA